MLKDKTTKTVRQLALEISRRLSLSEDQDRDYSQLIDPLYGDMYATHHVDLEYKLSDEELARMGLTRNSGSL